MLKVLFFVLLISLSNLLMAQTGAIKGLITDRQSKQPVEYASIALLKSADSSLVSGTISKGNGAFQFDNVATGKYVLKTAFIGYHHQYSEVITVSNGLSDAGTITLVASQRLLNEVNVTGQQINSLNKIDKQSYKAGQFESAKGGSAIDVLKNLPSVSVNGEGEISVRGSSGFMVLITENQC
ncbi:MAG: carboxypeptidase regulatory-like domain-containing protein [Mucilaginibacter sp.]